MSKNDSYVSHNFDAVNNQIRQIANRERARSFAYWLKSLQTIFLYMAIVALIVAFLVLIFSWAYRIVNAPYVEKETEIVRPEIIEKEVLKVVQVPVEKSILETSDSNYKGPTNQVVGNLSSQDNTSPANIVTNYNTFQNAAVPQYAEYGFAEVITGWKYKDSESSYPEYQYCYITKYSSGKSTTARADLAEINEDGSFINNVDSSLALDIGIPKKILNEAVNYCSFASAN